MQQLDLSELLKSLYHDQLNLKYDEYLHLQSRSEGGIRRRVDAFLKYKPYLKPGRVLDWGCKHSVDGCLIRHTLGQEVTILGCDTCDGDFATFHRYAGLQYVQLEHPFLLPYKDGEFDVVISSGVLEHVPNDSESLKEVYRILKPGGVFIITFLPNRFSYTENIVEWLGGASHKRTYSLNQVKSMLLHHGFVPRLSTYHQVVPSFSSLGSNAIAEKTFPKAVIRFLFTFNNLLENIWFIRRFASNLMFVAEKVEHL
jgi:ubiquinone/menaquinone biosynthesis C-methylase UbiE